jgi:hypothetical protein
VPFSRLLQNRHGSRVCIPPLFWGSCLLALAGSARDMMVDVSEEVSSVNNEAASFDDFNAAIARGCQVQKLVSLPIQQSYAKICIYQST